eukprot:7473703-Heterocapsa_arctica.AAC.1
MGPPASSAASSWEMPLSAPAPSLQPDTAFPSWSKILEVSEVINPPQEVPTPAAEIPPPVWDQMLAFEDASQITADSQTAPEIPLLD